MRGGGMAGPSGDVASERAGESGEYHHSRNLMKKMAVGRRNRRESSRRRGEEERSWRSRVLILSPWLEEGAFWAARLAARCQTIYQGSCLQEQSMDAQNPLPLSDGGLPVSRITKVGKKGFCQTDKQCSRRAATLRRIW